MPDDYETALGWAPATQDHNVLLEADTLFMPGGYTRLEEYLQFLAVPHTSITGSVTVDLREYTRGFTAAPTFTVANVTGGTVQLTGPGNCLATFTPTRGYVGRARFDFTVVDAGGSRWTQPCALLVRETE